MIDVAINGFGRIGRCVARLCQDDPTLNLVAVNDVLADRENLAYLYNYDSTYGRAAAPARTSENANKLQIDGSDIDFFSDADISAVPWEATGADVVIDASGVTRNVAGCQTLTKRGSVANAVVTHVPANDIDRYLIMGINDTAFDPTTDSVVSSSICDANAIAHVLQVLDTHLGLVSGFVTPLHPWLSYQNLLDKPLSSQANPGHYWSDYSLGRASMGTLIPKKTTAISALGPVMPEIAERISAFSYRVPTAIVASADMTLKVAKSASRDEVAAILENFASNSPYVTTNHESLTAIDYVGTAWSATIDMQWTEVKDDMIKVVLWYDNEWGYASRVLDVVRHIAA